MIFSDPKFFLFFAVYIALHFITPPRWRIYLIIFGSTVFYAWWRIDYVPLPYGLALIAWAGALWLSRAEDHLSRKRRLITTLIALFVPLGVAKYAHFFVQGVAEPIFGPWLSLGDVSFLKFALPLGISFMTFTLTAYVVDVYRGRYPLERRLNRIFAYVLFFPHLIAGPILRPHELLPQFNQKRIAIDARFTLGIAVFTLGLVKKLVFADTIAETVDHVFAPGSVVSGWEYLLAIHGFSMQIYCDFSGYTDMAIGLAYIIRIRLPTNFLRPYTARSPVEFWRRWHVTLSFWLRDYLYIPLGGNRHGRARQVANLVITMVLGGLWHGAAWTFVIWGFLHGIVLAGAHVVSHVLRRFQLPRLPSWVGVGLTFYFVTFTWVYFRAPDLESAHRVLAGPFLGTWAGFSLFLSQRTFELILLTIFFVTHRYDRHALVRIAVRRTPKAVIWPGIILMFVLAITVSQGSSGKFIYFDF